MSDASPAMKRSARYHTQFVFLIALLAALLAGCGDDTPESDKFLTGQADFGFISNSDVCTGDNCGPYIPPVESVEFYRDTDRDGLPDGVEDANGNGVWDEANGETDFNNPDSDADGLFDGFEDLNKNGVFDEGETDPLSEDTDNDGLLDGIEDANNNGVHDAYKGETSPLLIDTDNDGLNDLIEFGASYNGRSLDPNLADTDKDGLPDGIEDANANGALDITETDPTRADSDEDQIPDGCEDLNANGVLDEGELNPLSADSDGDGLRDGGFGGECDRLPFSGCSDFDDPFQCSTNPLLADTDDDGLSDLVEVYSDYGGGISTDPRDPDSDADGLLDGEEDYNRDGRYNLELGELNPINPTSQDGIPDAQRPQAEACGPMEMPMILDAESANVRFAHAPEMELTELDFSATGDSNFSGWAIDHPSLPISGFILSKTPDLGTDALRQARVDGARLGGSIFFEQTVNTWDDYQARLTVYRITESSDISVRGARNKYMTRLADLSEGDINGFPSTTSGTATRMQLHVLTVYRSNEQVLVIGAVVPSDTAPSDALLVHVEHLTNGTSLAKTGDVLATDDTGALLNSCDFFRVSNLPIVDFLFVVDDTNSMSPYQNVLSEATDQIFESVRSSFISARWSIASTDPGVNGSSDGAVTQCGLLNNPQGPSGSIWSPFDSSYQSNFQCRVRDPIGVQNCDASGAEQPGFAEYGLLCSKWAIEHIQGKRGNAADKNRQRPRSGLILVVITDEPSNLLTYPSDLDNGSTLPIAEQTTMLDFLGVLDWIEVNGPVVGQSFIDYFKGSASEGLYSEMTPFFIYSKNSFDFRGGYHDVMDEIPGTFPRSSSLDIRGCTNTANCSDIGDFVQNIVRVASALASPFDPTYVPVTVSTRAVIQRGFTEANETLSQSFSNGWAYDPAGRSLQFTGPSRPELLDAIAVSYPYWITPDN